MAEYVIKVIVCQVILFLFYHFFLAKEKMHHFNRFYLIFSLFFSVIIPMVNIPVYFPTAIDFTSLFFLEQGSGVYSATQEPIVEGIASLSLSKWLTIIYILTLLFFTFRMIRNLFRINLVAMVCEKIDYKGYEILLTESEILPYSFLKRIFINRKDYESGKISDELLMHEIYHIQQRHSIDIIIAEVIQALFWFNPILIFHKQAIRLNHEYLVDQAVINNQVELKDYQNILVEAVSKNNILPITSGFSAIWTKKRLLMMTKNRSLFFSSFKIIMAIPIIFLITVSFIFNRESDELKSERELTAIFTNYPNFYGTWEGNGIFFNCSLNKKVGEIPFQIIVNEDKTIEGTIGNAILVNATILKARYGIEIQAMLSQPVKENEIIDKDGIIILWGLPEMENGKVDANFHLTNNFFFDVFVNAGGVILTKTDDK
ncbi:MAG: hypothetical protein K8S16_08180 [Bacteroidales bacterium]|nr:hypothetical protein [Bacteroidales bacterium]